MVLVSVGQGPADCEGHFRRKEDEGHGTVVGVMLCLLDVNGAVYANLLPPSVSLLSNLILAWSNKVVICTPLPPKKIESEVG